MVTESFFTQNILGDIILTVFGLGVASQFLFNNNMKDAELLVLFLICLNSRRFLLCTSLKKD